MSGGADHELPQRRMYIEEIHAGAVSRSEVPEINLVKDQLCRPAEVYEMREGGEHDQDRYVTLRHGHIVAFQRD